MVKDTPSLWVGWGVIVEAWQPCAGAAASLPVWSVLSGGQEMPPVSAVSLMANRFTLGGGDSVYVCVCVLERAGWQQKERGKPEKRQSHQDALGTFTHPVS